MQSSARRSGYINTRSTSGLTTLSVLLRGSLARPVVSVLTVPAQIVVVSEGAVTAQTGIARGVAGARLMDMLSDDLPCGTQLR